MLAEFINTRVVTTTNTKELFFIFSFGKGFYNSMLSCSRTQNHYAIDHKKKDYPFLLESSLLFSKDLRYLRETSPVQYRPEKTESSNLFI